MLYQKLLLGDRPYFVAIGTTPAFEVHRHPEIEISYCLEGTYDIICQARRYTLAPGDFAVVGPMAIHEFPDTGHTCRRMTIELGYTFLGAPFDIFTAWDSACCVLKKTDSLHPAQYPQLVALLEETALLRCSDLPFSGLSIQGNLYKICALLLQMLQSPQENQLLSRRLSDMKKVDKALEYIYNRYYEPLTIEEVSVSCGYSKSNFCRIFRQITGDTFHNTLNRHRVEIACDLLRSDNLAIAAIAAQVGFPDAKSFCRTFKRITGKSTGEYKKNMQK